MYVVLRSVHLTCLLELLDELDLTPGVLLATQVPAQQLGRRLGVSGASAAAHASAAVSS
jgi:hypothetical protein